MNEFNDALVKGAIDGLKEIAKDVVKGAVALGRKQIGRLAVDFEYGFKDYLDRNYKRLSRIKTLLNPSEPIALEVTYVSPTFSLLEQRLAEKSVHQLCVKRKVRRYHRNWWFGKIDFSKAFIVRPLLL